MLFCGGCRFEESVCVLLLVSRLVCVVCCRWRCVCFVFCVSGFCREKEKKRKKERLLNV